MHRLPSDYICVCVLFVCLFGAHLSFKSPFLPFLIYTFTLCGAKFSFHIAHSFAHNILLLLVLIVAGNEQASERSGQLSNEQTNKRKIKRTMRRNEKREGERE